MSRNKFLYGLLVSAALLAPLSAHAEQPVALRLELAKVQLYLETGKINEAEDLLTSLKKRWPNDLDIKMAEAEVALKRNQRSKGLSLLSDAEKLAPKNEDIRRRREEVLQDNSTPYKATIGHDYRKTGDSAHENLTKLQSDMRINDRNSLHVTLENDALHADQLSMPDGSTARVRRHMQRGEAMLRHTLSSGDQIEASLSGAESGPGGGALYRWVGSKGSTELGVYFHRPDWEYLEGIVSEGVRDTLRVKKTHQISEHWSAEGTLSVNRYGLDSDPSVAKTGAFEGYIGWTIPQLSRDNTYVTLGYGIDAEYGFGSAEERFNPLFGLYKPLPFESREIHSGLISAGTSLLNNRLQLEGYGGYAWDRLGGNGPVGGATVAYTIMDKLVVDVHGSYSSVSERRDDKVSVLGLNVSWIF